MPNAPNELIPLYLYLAKPEKYYIAMTDFNIKKLKYDTDHILDRFQLTRGNDCAVLNQLLQVQTTVGYTIPAPLEAQRQKLEIEGSFWNEEELKMHFLSPLFLFSDFEVPRKMKLFYERLLSAIVQDTPLTVICDAMLASPFGVNTPKAPYFFLQEFKKGKKSQDDAEGQMLVAMLIAQEQNKNNKPIYGCYLLGKDWYFTSLYEKSYCFSKSYDATQIDELIQIIHILQNLKNIIPI